MPLPNDAMSPPKTSAIYDVAYEKAEKTALDIHQPLDPRTLHAIATEAEARAVYGHDAQKDRNGNFVQQGIGSKGHETANHFSALRRYEGEQKYQAALREIWGRDRARAEKLGLEKPERLGA